MDAATARLVIEMIPVAMSLTEKVIEAAKKVKEAGYEVPSIEELKAENDKLRALPDL